MKLLVSDYDGTFHINDLETEKNVKVVRQFMKHHRFILATGRSYCSIIKEIQKFHIPYHYLILNHGALILDSKHNILKQSPLSYNDFKKIESLLKNENQLDFKIYSYTAFEEYKELVYPCLKIYISFFNRNHLLTFYEKLKKEHIHVYCLRTNALEIIMKEVSKSKAIYHLLKEIRIPKEHVYTVGDSDNDIEMIQDYQGYAISSGNPLLKSVALDTTSSVWQLITKIDSEI